LSVFFKAESDVEKGNYADAMKHITADMSEILVPFIDDLIEFINYKTPIVK